MRHLRQSRTALLNYLPAAVVTVTALTIVVLAPFLALQWYRLPFLGVLLEPTLVVHGSGSEGWPAHDAGARYPDRLTAARGTSVKDSADLNNILEANGLAPIFLRFEHQDGEAYTILVTPRAVTAVEFVQLFLIPYLSGFAFLLTGLWAFRLNPTNQASRTFLLFTAATSISASAFHDMRTTHMLSLAWVLSLPVAGGALAQLALVFPKKTWLVSRLPALRFSPWIPAVLVAIPAALERLSPSDPWAYIPAWRNEYLLVGAGILLFLGMMTYRSLGIGSSVVRQQSRIIVFGALLAFGPILALFFAPLILGQSVEFRGLVLLPPLVLFPVSVAYAIVRYRLLDIDRALSGMLSYGLTMGGAVALYYFLLTVLSLLIGETITANDPLLIALFMLALVALFNPLRVLFQNAVNRVFYRTRGDLGEILSHLSRSMILTPDPGRLLDLLNEAVTQAFNPKGFVLYLFDDERKIYLPHSLQPHSKTPLLPESALVRFLNEAAEASWLPGVPYPEALSGEATILEELGFQIYVPLMFEAQMNGVMALGPRRSGEPYSSDDLDFLNTVAGQSSLGVENTRLFANLERTLSEILEMKNLMDDLFSSMPTGVITTDMEYKITLFNLAAERILGIPSALAMGLPLAVALPAFWPGLRPLADSTIREGRTILGEEYAAVSPKGSHLHLHLSATPLRDAQMKTIGTTILIDDYTEKRQLEEEREHIRQTFGRVVAPRVRDRLLLDPGNLRLDGVSQTVTVLFADLHNFTPYSEQNSPTELFSLLNSYLSLAAQAVLTEEGTLDKFMGDAVMALWNAPDQQDDHTIRAVRAALAIKAAVRDFHTGLAESNRLHFATGIACGEAIVGNVGTDELFNFTAIGETVNLAQRLQTAAKPGQVLLSESAYQFIKDCADTKPLSPIRVKGFARPVKVYELRGLKPAA